MTWTLTICGNEETWGPERYLTEWNPDWLANIGDSVLDKFADEIETAGAEIYWEDDYSEWNGGTYYYYNDNYEGLRVVCRAEAPKKIKKLREKIENAFYDALESAEKEAAREWGIEEEDDE